MLVFDNLHRKKYFIIFKINFLYFNLCLSSLILSLGNAEKCPALLFFTFPHHIFIYMMRSSWDFSKLSTPSFLNLSVIWEMLQSLNHLCGSLLDFSPVCPITSSIKEPITRPSTPDVSYQDWVEGKGPHFDLLAMLSSSEGCLPYLPEGHLASLWPTCYPAGPFFSQAFLFSSFP